MTDTQNTGVVTAPKPWVYEGDRHFFEVGADNMAKCSLMAQAIAVQVNPETGKQFKVIVFDKEWPSDAGAAILPLARNEERVIDGEKATKRILHAVMVWPYFGIESVQSHKDGAGYLRELVQEDQASRILNPTRRQPWEKMSDTDWANVLASCPATVSGHIEGMAADRGTVKAYMEAAKDLLPHLKKMHAVFAQMQAPFLRQLLSSAALAKSFAAGLEAKGFFVGLIDKLEAITKAKGMPTDIYTQWRETRDEAVIESVDDLDIASLGI